MVNSFYKIILYGVLVVCSCTMYGQNKLRKEVKETHTLSNDGALYLDNKYGDVYINGWEKDAIEIIVDIEAESKNIEKTKELLNRINPNIVATNKQIIIKSEISKKKKGFFNRYLSKIDPFKNEKTKINYTVYLPKNAEVEVLNKYGNIIITDWNGVLKADVEHGDIRIRDDIKGAKIKLKYGSLNATGLTESGVTGMDATLSIHFANTLKITSDGSEININKVDNLELYSNKDKIDIKEVNKVFGTIKYSTAIFNLLGGNLNLDLDLAELRILKHMTNTPILNINQKASEVYINISNTSFEFNAKLEQGVLRIPKTMQNINSEMLDRKNKIRHISATYGAEKPGTFVFTGVKGVIILKEL